MHSDGFKSIEAFIQDLVRKFEYEDFIPGKDYSKRFQKIINKENYYWRPIKHEYQWPNTFFIELKSLEKVHKHIRFKLRKNSISINIFETSTYDPGEIRFPEDKEVYIHDVWLNHSVLYEALIEVTNKALSRN